MIKVIVNNNLYQSDDNKVLLIKQTGVCLFLAKDFDFTFENLKNMLDEENGYCLIIIHPDKVFFAVDRIRTYPLFYAIEGEQLFIGDDASWIKSNLCYFELNKNAAIELFQSGFVTGDQTLYKNIFTLQAGESALATRHNRVWTIEKERYFEYYPESEDSQKSLSRLCSELDGILHRTFTSLVERNRDRTLVVPLSGGLDSRIIVSWLKRLGCKNVFCYSFGTPANRDCKKAQEVACKLQYKWVFVNLTRKLWKEAYKSNLYHQLKMKYSGYCSIMSSQEFPAFYGMIKQGILPENSVIIPGHTGDFISGGHIPNNILDYQIDVVSVSDYIFQKHFMLWKTINFRYRRGDYNYLNERITEQIGKYNLNSHEDIAKIFELYDWQERQAKFIVQFVNVYRLFGFVFELPLWSKQLMEFFLKLPLELKLDRKLYKNYLLKFDRFTIFSDIQLKRKDVRCGKNKLSYLLLKELKEISYQRIYRNWIYKQFIAYFKDDLNFYTPFSYFRLVSSFAMYRNPNSFFVQDFLKEIESRQF